MIKVVVKIIKYLPLLLIGVVLYVGFLIVDYADKSIVVNSDAVIVLGAAINHDQPSPVFKERINHGINLYQSGVVKKLIFTGGVGKGQSFSEARVAQAYAIKNGVKAADILIEEKSKITYENFIESKNILTQNKLNSVLVVSDPLHMKRAMAMADQLKINARPSPTPTSRYKTWKTKSGFLVREIFFFIGYVVRRKVL